MTDEHNDNLSQASDFFGGISDLRETSKVTHRAIYDDMLGALMERVAEIEKMIVEQDDILEEIKKERDRIELRFNIIIVSFWVLIVFLVVFCVAVSS